MNTKISNTMSKSSNKKILRKWLIISVRANLLFTYALQRLEKEFDTVLITRDGSHHELIVTPSGKQLFLHAQTILQEISTARAEITQLQKKKLRFGMPPIIGNEYFPRPVKLLYQA